MTREKILNEIEQLMGRIGQTDYDNVDYQKYQSELKAWQDILAAFDASVKAAEEDRKLENKDKKQRRIDMTKMMLDFGKTTIAVAGTLTAVCVIVYAEQAGPSIVKSKGMTFVTKMLPKIV